MPRRRSSRKPRPEPRSLWINAPLQNLIRDELDHRAWSAADLARAIGSQPSLISRWMMGQRPNTESISLIADAMGLDERQLLILAGHMAPNPEDLDSADPRILNLIAKLRQVELTDERYGVLDVLLEDFRQRSAVAEEWREAS